MFDKKKVAKAEKVGEFYPTKKGGCFVFSTHPYPEEAMRVVGLLCSATDKPLKRFQVISGKYQNNPPTEVRLYF